MGKEYLFGEDELVTFTSEVHIENLQMWLHVNKPDLLAAGFSAIFPEDGLPSDNILELFFATYVNTQLEFTVKCINNLEFRSLKDLDSRGLDRQYDYDFTNVKDDGKIYMRGGHQYHRPYGWYRIALKVHGKYPEGDEWLGPNDIRTEEAPNEWAVSYHGTKFEHVGKIFKEGLKPGPRAKFGPGIYSSPSPQIIEALYAQEFEYNGQYYKIAFQNRVNPHRVKIIPASETNVGAEYWIAQEGEIRPYGVIIKEIVKGGCNIS